ncbi:hypothetical protein OP492_16320 [Pseudomonas mosselii]|uniref:hypothetical protein n=1 Tax=Pseudomonas mosselii TaxID=78327 RepID=UPI0021A52F10|nr:hypothetical protein [Pseudomonas mosselii]MEA3236215.1 hypothetical protein [Pseudomonas mosselii]UWS68630.1 hypothetical protein N0U38_07515 [Pseudomonas mosselii]
MSLDQQWEPGFGTIYTWLAMDRVGRIAVMVNNCFGDIPKVLLALSGAEEMLDAISEFMWEESQAFRSYPPLKKGGFTVDFYSAWRWQGRDKAFVLDELLRNLEERGIYSEASLAFNKGFFVYPAVEGSREGEDFPVGFDGPTSMGDYFRFLVPGEYASIEDFPESLRAGIVVSQTLDFNSKQVLSGKCINEYFYDLYRC